MSKVKVTMDIYGNKPMNAIETKPLHIFLFHMSDMITMVRGRTLLILEVRSQRSRSQCTHGNKLVNAIKTKPLSAS